MNVEIARGELSEYVAGDVLRLGRVGGATMAVWGSRAEFELPAELSSSDCVADWASIVRRSMERGFQFWRTDVRGVTSTFSLSRTSGCAACDCCLACWSCSGVKIESNSNSGSRAGTECERRIERDFGAVFLIRAMISPSVSGVFSMRVTGAFEFVASSVVASSRRGEVSRMGCSSFA